MVLVLQLASVFFEQHLDFGVKHFRQFGLEQLVEGGSLAFLEAEPCLAVCVVIESLGSTVMRQGSVTEQIVEGVSLNSTSDEAEAP